MHLTYFHGVRNKGFLLFLSLFFICSLGASAQQLKLSYSNTPLKSVLKEITNQTGYTFAYSDALKQVNTNITCEINSNEPIQKVLPRILEGKGITFTITGKQIVLAPDDIAIKGGEKAQPGGKINGKITDDIGEPLPGVTIQNKTTQKIVASDLDGYYSIEAKEGDVLSFASIGMIGYDGTVGKTSILNVQMKPDAIALQDVVVTGYQEVSKNQSTSSVAVVRAENLNLTGVVSIEGALQGQLAGLSVITTNVTPGAAPKVRVRGTATIMGNAEPLWVLDGVILENAVPVTAAELNSPDFMNTFNSAIGGVSPNDIESITVLKDASATAIYGTRAANGVIVVTTKKGKISAGRLSYAHSSTMSLKPSYNSFNLLNSKQRVQLAMENAEDGLTISGDVGMENLMQDYFQGKIQLNDFQSKVQMMQERNTDWFDLLYRNAYTQTHDLSFSGATEKMDYYVSLGYNGEEGLDKISDYKNLNGMAKVNAEIFTGVKLGATLHLGQRMRDSYFSNIDPFKYAASASRTIPLYNQDGSPFYYRYYNLGGYQFNILNEQKNTKKTSDQTDLKANISLDVKLWKRLKYKGLVSLANSSTKNINYAMENTAYASGLRKYNYGDYTEKEFNESPMPYGGFYSEYNLQQKTYMIRNTIEYNGIFFNRDFHFDAMAGQEFRNTDYNGFTANTYGYMHDRGSIHYNPPMGTETGHLLRNLNSRNLIKRSNESYFGVMSAMYKNTYVVNANIRFDGSNLFGSNPKYRYLPLWSVSGKWIISNEAALVNSNVISLLAVRASYGLRGNIVEESSPQLIASALPPNPSTGLLEMIINQPPNPDLKWETTASLNLGIDMAFFNNRLSITADYFRDMSRDLIAFNKISAVSGFLGKYVNYADVKNQGLDISVSGDIIRTSKATWTMSVNMGYVANEVTKSALTPSVSDLVRSIYTPGSVVVGKPVNSMYSYKFAGLDEEGLPMFYDKNDKIIKTNDPEMSDLVNDTESLRYEGTRDPKITGGFNNIVKFKNFTFSALFSFGLMGKVRLPALAYMTAPIASDNANATILERWRKPGDEKHTSIPKLSGGSSFFYGTDGNTYYTTEMFNNSDYCVVSGDYLRLRNITLEYKFPSKIIRNIHIGETSMSGLSIKVQANNLFVLANKRLNGYDPETINFSTGGYGSLPIPKTFSIGLNLNF